MMKKLSLKGIFLLHVLCVFTLTLKAQDNVDDYKQIAKERADKIVAQLDIKDKSKATRVSQLIAAQYQNLNMLQGKRDGEIKTAGAIRQKSA